MTKIAWDNANLEGRALRRIFTRLERRFVKEERKPEADEEKLMRLAHMIAIIAKTKQELAKYEYQDKRIKMLEEYINSRQIKTGELTALT